MAIDLKFSKADKSTPWGFRVVGGVDFEQPLVVVKVDENSLAEEVGLQIGDIIVRVNDTPTSSLTHAEANDVIHSAGVEFNLGIRRGAFPDLPGFINDVETNEEVTNILSNDPEQVIPAQNINIGENLSGKEQMITTEAPIENFKKTAEKKWSTFLQKPKRPKPIPKKQEEPRQIIGEPYTVKIVKQKRRLPNEKKVKFEPEIVEIPQVTREDSIQDNESNQGETEMQGEINNNEEEMDGVEFTELSDEEDKQEQEEESVKDETQSESIAEKDEEIPKLKPIDIHIEPVIGSSLSLEEQLAAVQKQLLALSQLPSAIQTTLEAVTQQLNKIVTTKSSTEEENKSEDSNENNVDEEEKEHDPPASDEECDERSSGSSVKAENEITEDTEDENEFSEEKEEDDQESDRANTVETQDTQKIEEEPQEPDPYAGLTEEEKEARIMEEQQLAKKQKEMEEKRKQRDWVQRPIILPGGRKWVDPDDVVPRLARTPKMSDEKIYNTLDSFAEVIVGKTKGINFLKYTPPPKKLDYLQNSEVYKIIHDMEPPAKGIGNRAEIIMSEQDYYQDKIAP